jgi:hypothetical protein
VCYNSNEERDRENNLVKTEYYKNLTKSQFEVLVQIAFGGESFYHSGAIIDKLMKMGLIWQVGEKALYGKTNHPIDRISIMIPIYEMPIPEHIEFCQWCSEHPEIDEENKLD